MKKIGFFPFVSVLLCLAVCLSLAACADFSEDARIGTYHSRTDGYTLHLYADGTGEITFISTVDGEHREPFHFTLRGDELLITGTATSGGVIGRGQYSGIVSVTEDGTSVSLYNEETSLLLGIFDKAEDTP